MAKTKLILAAVLFTITACAESPTQSTYHWRDTTGKGRGERLALSDAESCHRAHGTPRDAGPAAERLALEHFNACMRERGWEVARE